MPTYDESIFLGLIVVFVFAAARLFWLGDLAGRAARLLLRRRS